MIYHGAHHKMGTTWLTRVLEGVAKAFGLKVTKSNSVGDPVDEDTDILIANHSHISPDSLGNMVGSHMIRDLRDVVVSGYYYHLRTNEAWVKQPSPQYSGRSYQEALHAVDRDAGLTMEIHRLASSHDIQVLRSWDFGNPRLIELTYENLWQNEQLQFRRLFEHYGFHRRAISRCLKIVKQNSFQAVSKSRKLSSYEKLHVRSGQPGQWKFELNENHCELIKTELGDLLVQLGQANDNHWSAEAT